LIEVSDAGFYLKFIKSENKEKIRMKKDNFKRYGDNGKIKKEFMLLALSNIELIMIKAKVAQDQSSVM